MARLPDPITEKLMAEWPDETEWRTRNKSFSSILGEAVRKAELRKNREDDENEH